MANIQESLESGIAFGKPTATEGAGSKGKQVLQSHFSDTGWIPVKFEVLELFIHPIPLNYPKMFIPCGKKALSIRAKIIVFHSISTNHYLYPYT